MSSPSNPPRDLRPTVRQSGTMSANRRARRAPRPPKEVSALQTRIALLTYALSRLPPRQLPLLAVYASSIVYAADKGWIPSAATGKAAASIVGVLSMVTGLLLSHRFSSAVSKWDEGKRVWVAVRTDIRDAIRLISVQSQMQAAHMVSSPQSSSPPSLISMSAPSSEMSSPRKRVEMVNTPWGTSPPKSNGARPAGKQRESTCDGMDELAGLFVGFAFALQHHLHSTRPLPQPPLCDILPPAYLASLKRTEARVRFAEASSSRQIDDSALGLEDEASDFFRPGLRRRGTGPPSNEERSSAKADADEWELSNLKEKAEVAVSRLAEAVSGVGGIEDVELRRQLDELSHITGVDTGLEDDDAIPGRTGPRAAGVNGSPSKDARGIKSNLANPTPPNLPLAILKLLEAYVIGLSEVPTERGGWSEAKRERALGIVKAMSANLSEAERLSSTPPPLPLTLHSYHLLTIYLAAIPPSLLCAVSGPALVIITLIAGWCLLGLEALVNEVGGVFGGSEKHHPLPTLTHKILVESLDMYPAFGAAYRARLVSRVGEDDGEVAALDQRRRGREEWTPGF